MYECADSFRPIQRRARAVQGAGGRRRELLALAAIALASAACSARSAVGEKLATPAPFATPSRTQAPRSLRAELDRIIDEHLRTEPRTGRWLGLHAYDGKIADYSPDGIRRRVERLDAIERALDSAAPPLTDDDKLDVALVRRHVALNRFRLVELRVASREPQFYEELFAVNDYLDRDYAPLEERVARLVEHEEAALLQVHRVRQNLTTPLAKRVIETAIKIYDGYASYLRNDVAKLAGAVGTPELRTRFARANEALAREAEALAKFLREVELPRGDESHVLGPNRFKQLLEVQEGFTGTLAEFKAMGEQNLAENKAAYEALLAKGIKPKRIDVTALMREAESILEGSRRFVKDRALVTIPAEDRAVLRETPPYMRYNAAFLNAAGPFEARPLALYYMTLPDPAWPKEEQEAYVMSRGVLAATTVHEVYPGHFLQSQWVRRAPTRVQKLFDSYSFVEGWAHYAEQLLIDEGFGAGDPELRLGQLSDALLRNCRYVVALAVHAEGMSLKQAERRFIDDCHQDKATAREQATRATFDPGYFAYTLGKLQILELRAEAQRRLGAAFSMRAFHDALLSHGAPPIPLVRERVMRDLGVPDDRSVEARAYRGSFGSSSRDAELMQ